MTAEGRLEGIEEAGGEAAITITAHLLGLLVTFVGESLTRRLMRKALPDTSDRMIEESEDFK
jgi:hypothetical protein